MADLSPVFPLPTDLAVWFQAARALRRHVRDMRDLPEDVVVGLNGLAAYADLVIARQASPMSVDELRVVLAELQDDSSPSAPPRLLGREDTASYIGVSVPTLDRMVGRGELTPVPMGGRVLFDRKDLDEMIDARKLRPATKRRAA